MTAELAKVGTFCPNPACPDYEQVQESGNNIRKFGHTRSGRRRYKRLRCGKTFTETRGTIFHRRRTDEKEILECPAMIAEGSRISSVSRVKGHKEDTISAWLRDAAEHTETVEDILLSEFRISRERMGRYPGGDGGSVRKSSGIFRVRQTSLQKTAATGPEVSADD